MKVLAIGNSFSQDATRYLHDLARAEHEKIEVINLYIGGCSLERHYRNMLGDKADYQLECNGHQTGFFVSIKEALLSREWDVITLQQASPLSPKAATYEPYLSELAAYVRRMQPHAKLVIHQTWAYEEGSHRLLEIAGYPTPQSMMADVKQAYEIAAKHVCANGIIPSGELFAKLCSSGIPKVHRDTFHASLGLGRYALGLLWYRCLLGKSVADHAFCPLDEPISDRELAIVKACVDSFDPIDFHTV